MPVASDVSEARGPEAGRICHQGSQVGWWPYNLPASSQRELLEVPALYCPLLWGGAVSLQRQKAGLDEACSTVASVLCSVQVSFGILSLGSWWGLAEVLSMPYNDGKNAVLPLWLPALLNWVLRHGWPLGTAACSAIVPKLVSERWPGQQGLWETGGSCAVAAGPRQLVLLT